MSINSKLTRLDIPSTNPNKREEEFDLSPLRGEKLFRMPLPSSPTRMKYPELRPSWWDKTHRILANLVKINRSRPLEKEEIEEIQEIAERITFQKDPIVQLGFLKLLSEFIFFDAKRIFFEVLGGMIDQFPEIEPYFKDLPLKRKEIVFTPKGIEKLLFILTKNYKLPLGALSLLPHQDLPFEIEQIIESKKENIVHGWILYDPAECYHYTAAFAYKKNGMTHLYIFDSLGHSIKRYDITSFDLDSFNDHFLCREELIEKVKIYSYKNKRQYSGPGCSVLAICDLKHLLERIVFYKKNLIDFYAEQKEENQPRLIAQEIDPDLKLSIYELNILPPELEKSSQSIDELIDFGKHPPNVIDAPHVYRYNPSWDLIEKEQDLNEYIKTVGKSLRFKREDSIHNLYLEQKRLQRVVELLVHHFKYQSSTPNRLKVERSAYVLGLAEKAP